MYSGAGGGKSSHGSETLQSNVTMKTREKKSPPGIRYHNGRGVSTIWGKKSSKCNALKALTVRGKKISE